VKSYSSRDISRVLEDVGVKKGDVVFFFVCIYPVGKLEGCVTKESYNKAYLDAIFSVIGEQGTLVVPTYSQQVGRFGIPYVHEETPTLSGVFSEYIRTYPKAIRSFHPVFSLTALGCYSQEICGKVGASGFGAESAYDHLFEKGGFSICLGFHDERSGKMTAGVHYIESTYGVPYYYNKILKADVYKSGQRCDKVFTLNVRYTDFGTKYNYLRFIKALRSRGFLQTCPVGDSILYSSRLEDQLKVGYELLSEDIYAFLEYPPRWREGVIPFEGPPEKMASEDAGKINWSGYGLQFRR
jgi:aminoglycoside 3-N-acetyltransferase